MSSTMLAATVLAAMWAIVTPPDWTADPNDPPKLARVAYWWTEYSVPITAEATTMYLGQNRVLDLPVDPAHEFSGRTICLEAYAVMMAPGFPRSGPARACHYFMRADEVVPPEVMPP